MYSPTIAFAQQGGYVDVIILQSTGDGRSASSNAKKHSTCTYCMEADLHRVSQGTHQAWQWNGCNFPEGNTSR